MLRSKWNKGLARIALQGGAADVETRSSGSKKSPAHAWPGFVGAIARHHFGANGGFALRLPSSSASIFAMSSASSFSFCASQLDF
jgi:hypothetical protein